jgi:Asp-tRNA(Asn)/Glu-tRNA(Gln) amidotransferase A subunit family amidase
MVIAVKDNIDVRAMPTTAGGRHLPPEPRSEDANCVRRLREASCAIIGKTALHEYALGVTSENPHYGDVVNPRDPRVVAGGSSGGSAVAVAAEMCDAALGTDTGGSVRLPAAFCEVVGFKPVRGPISRHGVFPISETLDAVGVLGRDVRTVAAVRNLVAHNALPRLATSMRVRRYRLAVPWQWMTGISSEVLDVFTHVAQGLPNIDLPAREALWDVAATITIAEGLRVHLPWLTTAPELYGDDVRALLESGFTIKAIDYLAARDELRRLRRATRKELAGVDAIVLPTSPSAPPLRGATPLELRRQLTGWTRPFNAADSAAISIPLPGTPFPIGLQIVANSDYSALSVALAIEQKLAAAGQPVAVYST